jgi:S1-C subfamily serine protease
MTMKRTLIVLLGVWGVLIATSADAQPTLDRVERQLRDQTAPQKLPAGAAPNAAEPGYLGVMADDRQEQGRGIRVLDLLAGGPAAQGGLLAGDLITAINGQNVRTMDDLARAFERQPAGTKLSITVNREGADRTLEITLGRRPQSLPVGRVPDELPSPNSPAPGAPLAQGLRLGVRTLPVTDEVRRQNELPSADGAMVVSVTVGSPADRAGVPLGAVITAVDGQNVTTPEELAAAIRKVGGREIELSYLDRGQETKKRILLAGAALPPETPKLELRARPVQPPAKPAPSDSPSAESSDDSRTAALEARIRELEARIEKLEAAMASDKK